MKKLHFLAKLGRVYGPVTEADFEALRSSGKIYEYTWMWNTAQNAWQAIDAAPAPLQLEDFDKPVVHVEATPTVSVAQPTVELGFNLPKGINIPVIGHDFRSVISGVLHQMNGQGCEFHTDDKAFAPTFVTRSAIILNLLDAKSGHLMNVSARVLGVTRSQNGWVYRCVWQQAASTSRALAS